MVTQAANESRAYETGDLSDLPVVASDIIYEGAAVGIVKASGHTRPLVAGDKFVGFSTHKADNSSGSAADINVKVRRKGEIELTVAGAAITDFNQPVYASDDNTFTLNPATLAVSNSFIGFIKRFVSSGVAIVAFDTDKFLDPYGDSPREMVSANITLDAQDNGKTLFVDTDAITVTLPAVAAGLNCTIVNAGAYGAVLVTISPQAADMIIGPDVAAVNDKDLLNTKVTAQRGDLASLASVDADGYLVSKLTGVWAKEP